MKRKIFVSILLICIIVISGLLSAFNHNSLKSHTNYINGNKWYSSKLTVLGFWSGNSYISANYYPSSDIYTIYVEYHGQNWISLKSLNIKTVNDSISIQLNNPFREINGGAFYESTEEIIDRDLLLAISNAGYANIELLGSSGNVELEIGDSGVKSINSLIDIAITYSDKELKISKK